MQPVYLISYIQRGNGTGTAFQRTYLYSSNISDFKVNSYYAFPARTYEVVLNMREVDLCD